MVKPQTRQELLIASRTKFDELTALINALPAASKTKEFSFKGRDRNLRDILVHLSAWQALYLHWSTTNLKGEQRVRFLPKGYTWQTSSKLSEQLRQLNQDLSVDEAYKRLQNTHCKMIRQFESLQQEQLFTHDFFNWTGSSTLGDYASLFSAERYEWAIRRLQHFRHDLAQKPLVTQ